MNITITGNLGSGKSSVAKILREKGYEIISTGNIFRQLAMEKGLSVEEFNKQVNEAASKGDRSVDKMIDDTTTKLGKERDHIVFDSRLAWHFAPDSFKVFVITDINEASRRVFGDSLRANSESYDSQEACKKALINRQKLETVRYKEIYDIDYYDMSNYNLVIESTNALPDEIAQEILDRLADYENNKFEKCMELNPSSIKITDTKEGSATIKVSEKDGIFTLADGRGKLEKAISNGDKFVQVSVTSSELTSSDSFMNFSKCQ
jgi:cytidylate kinase